MCSNSGIIMYNCNLCNKDHYKTFLNNVKLFTNKGIYTKLAKIPEEEKANVYKITKFKYEMIDKTTKFFDINKISCFTNVEIIDINIFNHYYILHYSMINKQYSFKKKKNFSNEIAQLQNLSILSFTDATETYLINNIGKTFYYIYEDKMIIFVGKKNSENLPKIPSNIKFLNIIADKFYDYKNLPDNIEYLHLSLDISQIKITKFSNLNINLKRLNIIFRDIKYDKKNEKKTEKKDEYDIKLVKEQCKIPFGCIFNTKILNFEPPL
jgi:hypothetical protein